jgi:hypothetical protein
MSAFIFNMLCNALFVYLCYRAFRYFSSESPEARDRQRKSTPLSFDDGVSYERFQDMARNASRRFKNVDSVTANREGIVEVKWHSNTRKSHFTARLDFNDWGHLTGRFWKERTGGCEMDVIHNIEGYFSGCIRHESRAVPSAG